MEKEGIKTNATISRELGLKLLHQMILIRRFEEKSAELYTKEKIRGFLHLYIGEEAVAVGAMHSLTEDDNILSTYREHGHALARGLDPGSIMAEMYGKQEGCSMGRGGSMHLFDASKRFYGGNAIVGGHLPMAVGMALASKKQDLNNITCCFFSEGAIAEGEFHESMNLAALWGVPVLFLCENNLYGMGTALRFSHSVQDLEKKGAAYGVVSAKTNGMDLLEVKKAVEKATAYIKSTGKPYFLVCNTYRFRAHSMFDAQLYREKTEVDEWKKRDPILTFSNQLLQNELISRDDIDTIEEKVSAEVQKAVDFAEAGTFEPVEDLKKYVYSP
ncbi:MAG: pyruvate dehydrogenase (acetyl-transferring) E1 component subunit alpha [Eudoraea sp.]|nr:pyruvate dehydrogenase (acetyl-transferring) E1 component subunit alpha [Eudoraea sp.]